jgi:hypothetical protein
MAAILLSAACSAASPAGQPPGTGAAAAAAAAIDGGPTENAAAASSGDASLSADAGDPGSPSPSGLDAQVDAAPITITASDGGTAAFDIVSPARCADKSAHLLDCAIPPTTIEGSSETTTGPLETILTVNRSGDCSSQFPLALNINAAGAPSTIFHLEDGTTTVKRDDGTAIDALSITDGSPWTADAAYDDSCRISIDVQMNTPASH